MDRHARLRDQRRDGNADGQDGDKGCGRKIDDEDGAIQRQLEEGIFLQARRAEIEPIHRQHGDPQRKARMIDQPAIEPGRERVFSARQSASNAQHDQGKRREHQRDRGKRVGREHDRLAAAKPGMIQGALRQQQQRGRGVHHIDRMLVGNLTFDREQPARKQIRIEPHREQDRQCQACGRGRDQTELLPARQRQKIERGQHGAVHQLERGDEAEQRSAGEARAEAPISVRV
ncbi:hypothetical protein JJB99_15500 [Bradyrhizobium diazoefficiens]|uniref:hypothetical protein n=1 Tax=Bradyrhizobium diazoefficiens TaxID=1355477 RepID=UPI00190DC6F6|nr:hypothetical protein [Bradyrhizobium diazoefficiens]QQO17436.1 hypothetical protein JJB99_15500 [Bradyrhizobium diazoefficiens]